MSLPWMLVGAVALTVWCGLVLADRRAAFVLIGGIIFVSALSPAKDYFGESLVTWVFALQRHRVELAAALVLPLAVRAMVDLATERDTRLDTPTLALGAIALYQGVLRLFHESVETGVSTVVFGVFTIVSLALCLPALLRQAGGLRRLLRCILFANVAWLACVTRQVAIDVGPLVLGERFTGLTANPQSAAIYLALAAVLCHWLVSYDTRQSVRVIAALTVLANMTLLVWTGSRTGIAALILGMLLSSGGVSRRALARAALLVAVTYVTFGVMQNLGAESVAARLTSGSSSGRPEALQRMLEAGLASPIVGNGIVDANASENSLLLGFAAFGVGMLGLLFFLMAVTASACQDLRTRPVGSKALEAAVNTLIAFYVMCLFISLFEGILLARFRETLVLMVIVNGAVGHLRRGRREDSTKRKGRGLTNHPRGVLACGARPARVATAALWSAGGGRPQSSPAGSEPMAVKGVLGAATI